MSAFHEQLPTYKKIGRIPPITIFFIKKLSRSYLVIFDNVSDSHNFQTNSKTKLPPTNSIDHRRLRVTSRDADETSFSITNETTIFPDKKCHYDWATRNLGARPCDSNLFHFLKSKCHQIIISLIRTLSCEYNYFYNVLLRKDFSAFSFFFYFWIFWIEK